MDIPHSVILQRNYVYLKENLQVDPVLDALYQGCVFTQGDYDRCRLVAPERQCELFLEILKKKGVEGYRTLCAVLDSTQPFIKEKLDNTSTEEDVPVSTPQTLAANSESGETLNGCDNNILTSGQLTHKFRSSHDQLGIARTISDSHCGNTPVTCLAEHFYTLLTGVQLEALFHHISGVTNVVADAMSRRHQSTPKTSSKFISVDWLTAEHDQH
ncbi:uncharacterized protein LOC124112673 isoform X1 [Haliotis rufescens]|uniref:uncharacterized protein LOC124112673 isoform X1 n=1 Tax=Haliotis rufescens TaxID=6454 RepID=UPI00201F4692|nr:uncharacterized protein LOC124112673 isoform X1 [Haliotis rufescens]XP_048247058.1 uncharacterized protein LOC124112673 isoform X1 [Haliotis rufescens]